MDILSHGLYGGVAFGRKSRATFWWSFFFGIAPDLFSFGIYLVGTWLGWYAHPDWSAGRNPDVSQYPMLLQLAYSLTHSLLVFILVFGVVWVVRRKPLWIMAGWGLHILVDIPTHSSDFFPTLFLWPISSFYFDGHPWATPEIFIPNVLLILLLYGWFYIVKPYRMRK